ncbi:MAG: hypothetical protein ABSG30_13495 [Steroidobacteraceae bacterium]
MTEIMCGEFLVGALGLPSILKFLPEAMSAMVLVYVIFVGTRDRFHLIAPKYWISFSALVVVMLCGIANNPAGTGPMLTGVRFFLRAVPLFFLPAVLPQTAAQLKRQMQLLLVLCLAQLPIAVYQRWVMFQREHSSGDAIRGTLLDSGFLSMTLISAVLVLTGLLLRGRISKLAYGVLFLLLLLPTTINETKGTIVFLPVCLFVTLIFGAKRSERLRYALMGAGALMIFGSIFVPIYNAMEVYNPYKEERDITNYFTHEKNLRRYMSSNVSGVGAREQGVRRSDAIMVPLQYLAKDPVRLAFGLGLGSVSSGNLGSIFKGDYFAIFEPFLILSFTFFLLEIGIFGLAIIGVLFWMVFRDTLVVAQEDDTLTGALAAGWLGVVALVAIAIAYNAVHESTPITYLYAYFSGLICARRVALAHGN